MNNSDRCLEILILLRNGTHLWGKYFEEFIENFSSLNNEQISALRDTVDAEVRYNFMYQFFGHVRKNFDSFDDNKKREVLNQLYLLIILENCDFDYRENIRLAESFSKTTKNYSDIKSEEWKKLSYLASDKLKQYLEGYFSA